MSRLPTAYFDAMYAGTPDPWGFTSRWYERRKAGLLLASLPEPRYRRAFEPGCGPGVLSADLAPRCDLLIGTDVVPAALAQARQRLAGSSGVQLLLCPVPEDWPDGSFDLIVLSELCYYFDSAELSRLLDRCEGALCPGGTLVAAHWRHQVADYPARGDDVHDAIRARGTWQRTVCHVEADFWLEVFLAAPPDTDPATLSVAARTGLVGAQAGPSE